MTKSASAAAHRAPILHARPLAMIFAVLGVVAIALIALHWLLVLKPTLLADAQSHSQVLAQAQARSIEQYLVGRGGALVRRDLETALDSVLLLKDQATGLPFVRRITVVMDDEYGDGPYSGLGHGPRCREVPGLFRRQDTPLPPAGPTTHRDCHLSHVAATSW